MTNPRLKIYYNPYTVTTEISLDDDPYNGSIIDGICNRRLSQWIDKFIIDLEGELNSANIDLIFEGTKLDAEDVKDAIELYNKKNTVVSINVKYLICTQSSEDRIAQLKNLFEEAQNGPIEEFRTPEIRKAFEAALALEFEVNVLATMSAGKSTVINAMLGMELMPTKNEACTATIVKIHDHDGMEDFEGKAFGADNKTTHVWKKVDNELLTK